MTNAPALDFVILFVSNPKESGEFYRKILGINPVDESSTFVLFSLANAGKLGLWATTEAEPKVLGKPGASEICFKEQNVDQLYDQWVKLNIPMAQAPTNMDFGRTFVALDPDGHRIRIYKYHGE